MDSLINSNCTHCDQRSKSIFCSLKTDELEIINSSKKCLVFEKGEKIFQEATAPKGIFCIQKGKVKVSQLGSDGKDQILHLATEGDLMGYRATLSGDIYSCSAVALEKSHICFIPKEVFISLVSANSKLALQVIYLFSDELKKIETNLTKITQRPVKERVAQTLLLLKNKYGLEEDGSTINVVIKREEIANLAGTTRESATRVIYTFQEKKLIELIGKKIKIVNISGLLMEAGVLD